MKRSIRSSIENDSKIPRISTAPSRYRAEDAVCAQLAQLINMSNTLQDNCSEIDDAGLIRIQNYLKGVISTLENFKKWHIDIDDGFRSTDMSFDYMDRGVTSSTSTKSRPSLSDTSDFNKWIREYSEVIFPPEIVEKWAATCEGDEKFCEDIIRNHLDSSIIVEEYELDKDPEFMKQLFDEGVNYILEVYQDRGYSEY